MFTLKFWKATAERAIATGAEAVIAVWGVGDIALNAFVIDWETAAGIALGGAALAVLKALAAFAVSGDGPGFGSAEVLSK